MVFGQIILQNITGLTEPFPGKGLSFLSLGELCAIGMKETIPPIWLEPARLGKPFDYAWLLRRRLSR